MNFSYSNECACKERVEAIKLYARYRSLIHTCIQIYDVIYSQALNSVHYAHFYLLYSCFRSDLDRTIYQKQNPENIPHPLNRTFTFYP